MAEIHRCAFLGPEFAVLFIGANEQTKAFLAHVIFAVTVCDRWQAAAHGSDFRHGFSDQILVFGWLQRQVDAGHLANFARPKAGGIDDHIGMDAAFGGFHMPGAVWLLGRSCHRAKALDASTHFARSCRIGHGDAGGIDIAAILLEHDAADAVKIDKRVFLFGFLAAEFVEFDTELTGLGALQAQLVFAVSCLGKVERTGLEHAAALAGFRFQLLVELHRVILQLGNVVVVVKAVEVGRRMPGGAGSQFVAFEQDDVFPAQFAQMIEDGTTDKTASDDDCLGVGREGVCSSRSPDVVHGLGCRKADHVEQCGLRLLRKTTFTSVIQSDQLNQVVLAISRI